MAIKVRLTNKSQVTKRQSETGSSPTVLPSILMSRALYQRLGSLVNNTRISEDYHGDKLPKEFVEFLDAMDDIKIINNTRMSRFLVLPETVVDLNWKIVDQYLGQLGLTAEYAYSRDSVDIPLWLDPMFQPEYRILSDFSDNTYLVDSNGDEILINYTGA